MALLIIMGVMWGLQFAMLKLATQSGHSDIFILMLSLALLSVIFLLITIVKTQLFGITIERLIFLVITSLLGYVVPLIATLHAAPHISVGILALMVSMTPVVTIAVALLFRTEFVSIGRILAVLLGVVAVTLVLWPELELPSYGTTTWMLVALGVPISYGIESIYIAVRWPVGLNPLQVVTGEVVMAALFVLPFFVFHENITDLRWSWSLAELGIVLFVIASAIEVMLYFYLIQLTGGVFVSFGTFISLFAGLAWGMILFSEVHSAHVWVAVIFLVLALVLACRDDQQNPKALT